MIEVGQAGIANSEDTALFALEDSHLPCQLLLGCQSQSDVKLSHNLFKLITFVIDSKFVEAWNSASQLCLRFTSCLKGKFRLTQYFSILDPVF